MARSRKAQIDAQSTLEVKTAESGINVIMDTPLEKTIDEAAQALGIDSFRLQELFVERLGFEEPMTWLTVPTEHEALLADIKRGLESEASVRRLTPQQEETPQLPPQPPILEEVPQSKQSKHESSALTEKKTEAIKETRETATQTNAGITQTLTLLQAQQGLIDSSQAGTAYLNTYTANLTNVKGEGLTVIAAQMLQEISQKSGFDPNEILQQVGVPLTPETQQKLQETMGQVLGKAQAASTQIQQTAWGNGYIRLLVVKTRLDVFQEHQSMTALFPTFSAMFRKLGNWLCPDQTPLEAFVVGDFLYWEV
jgi:hypothetical protein